MAAYSFPAGSMGPKVDAACRFAERPASAPPSARSKDLAAILKGEAGTTVAAEGAERPLEFAPPPPAG